MIVAVTANGPVTVHDGVYIGEPDIKPSWLAGRRMLPYGSAYNGTVWLFVRVLSNGKVTDAMIERWSARKEVP